MANMRVCRDCGLETPIEDHIKTEILYVRRDDLVEALLAYVQGSATFPDLSDYLSGSSNGRTADFESANLGSSPSPETKK